MRRRKSQADLSRLVEYIPGDPNSRWERRPRAIINSKQHEGDVRSITDKYVVYESAKGEYCKVRGRRVYLADLKPALPSLAEFNQRRQQQIYEQCLFPQPTGIACPKCGSELSDTDSLILTSNPPQRNVGCHDCQYRGYRFA